MKQCGGRHQDHNRPTETSIPRPTSYQQPVTDYWPPATDSAPFVAWHTYTAG